MASSSGVLSLARVAEKVDSPYLNQDNIYASYLYFVAIPSDLTYSLEVETQIDACFRSLKGTTSVSEHKSHVDQRPSSAQ
jgi:hypothetical protein